MFVGEIAIIGLLVLLIFVFVDDIAFFVVVFFFFIAWVKSLFFFGWYLCSCIFVGEIVYLYFWR